MFSSRCQSLCILTHGCATSSSEAGPCRTAARSGGQSMPRRRTVCVSLPRPRSGTRRCTCASLERPVHTRTDELMLVQDARSLATTVSSHSTSQSSPARNRPDGRRLIAARRARLAARRSSHFGELARAEDSLPPCLETSSAPAWSQLGRVRQARLPARALGSPRAPLDNPACLQAAAAPSWIWTCSSAYCLSGSGLQRS